jgi:hypothetical protein
MYLDEIMPIHVLRFKNYLASPEARKDGGEGVLAASTQLFIYKVFTAMMIFSCQELKLIEDNPTATISPLKLPKNKKKQTNVYSYEEAVNAIEGLFRLPMLWTLYFPRGDDGRLQEANYWRWSGPMWIFPPAPCSSGTASPGRRTGSMH